MVPRAAGSLLKYGVKKALPCRPSLDPCSVILGGRSVGDPRRWHRNLPSMAKERNPAASGQVPVAAAPVVVQQMIEGSTGPEGQSLTL